MTKFRCYCGEWLDIDEEDLGSEDMDCPKCGCLLVVPETWEDVQTVNDAISEELRTLHEKYATYRIMVEGEDRTEFCVQNNLPNNDLLDVIVDGYRMRYPEARRVFLEEEENYNSCSLINELSL